jgi:hypothetical protein
MMERKKEGIVNQVATVGPWGVGILFIPSDRPKSPGLFPVFFPKEVSNNRRQKLGRAYVCVHLPQR